MNIIVGWKSLCSLITRFKMLKIFKDLFLLACDGILKKSTQDTQVKDHLSWSKDGSTSIMNWLISNINESCQLLIQILASCWSKTYFLTPINLSSNKLLVSNYHVVGQQLMLLIWTLNASSFKAMESLIFCHKERWWRKSRCILWTKKKE